MIHTGFHRNKRVIVILKNGDSYVDRWAGKTDDNRFVMLQEHGKIKVKRIRAIASYTTPPKGAEKG